MPQASLIDAKANHDVAETALHAAEARRDEIRNIAGDPNAGGGMATLTFRAPVKGILQNLHAQVGQPVPAGALLFDVAELDPIWIKVPVYVGDVDRLALDKPAGVGSLADPPGVKVRPAQARHRAALRRPAGGHRAPLLRGRQQGPLLPPRPARRRHPPPARATRRAWPSPARH